MKSTSQVFRWRDQVKADRRLCSIDFKIAYQLSEKTNSAEFSKSGWLVTWQGIETLAAATGVCVRTVRYAIKRLQIYSHLAIRPGGGRHRSNRYTLILKPVADAETLSPGTPFQDQKPCKPLQRFDGETVQRLHPLENETLQKTTRNPASPCAKPCKPLQGNTSIRDLSNSSADPEPDDRGPRRADALGPLASLEPEVRKWLITAKMVAITADTVTLSVLTATERDNIIKHCRAEILALTGATRLEFAVELESAVEIPKLRRMP